MESTFYENNDLLIWKHYRNILVNFMIYIISRCVGCVTWRQLDSYLRKIPPPFQIMVSHPIPLSWDTNIYNVYSVLVAVKYSVAFIGPQYFQTFPSRMEIKVDFRHWCDLIGHLIACFSWSRAPKKYHLLGHIKKQINFRNLTFIWLCAKMLNVMNYIFYNNFPSNSYVEISSHHLMALGGRVFEKWLSQGTNSHK